MGVRVRTPSSKDVAQVASFGLGSDWANKDKLIQNMKVGTGIELRRSLGNLGSILVGLVLFKIVDAQREPKRFQGRLGVTNSATNIYQMIVRRAINKMFEPKKNHRVLQRSPHFLQAQLVALVNQ